MGTDPIWLAVLWSGLAGLTIPLGGWLAANEDIAPDWLADEIRHGIIAFGGGALMSAVALVLVPDGADALPALGAVACFVGGGVAFCLIDRRISASGGAGSQRLAMLTDFLPEAVSLGAIFASGGGSGPLLALLIALQNLPEAFNAFRETREPGHERRSLAVFGAMAALGPLAAILGALLLAGRPAALGAIMVFAAGGILYLVFQDIAPAARLERDWLPGLGAVLGFALGLAGHLVLG